MAETKKRSRRQWEAYVELNVNKIPREQLEQEMLQDGFTDSEINGLINRKAARVSRINIGLMVGGLLFAFIGIATSMASYESARSSYAGGTYYVWWGAVLVGIVSFFMGLVRFIQKK